MNALLYSPLGVEVIHPSTEVGEMKPMHAAFAARRSNGETKLNLRTNALSKLIEITATNSKAVGRRVWNLAN